MPRNDQSPVTVDFALQGGGAHGAFTWGVLDRALESPRMQIEGISGTSAGAMNAAVLADGYAAGGPEGARRALEAFWRRVSNAALLSPLRRTPLDILLGQWTMDYNPAFIASELVSRVFSPYDLGPWAMNPLDSILEQSIDFDRLKTSPVKIFVTATNVTTGCGRIFRNEAITPQVLLASGCLPSLYQAIEIDGEPYWDGGFSGNPSLKPLVLECEASDTILVQINPVVRPGTPRTAREILNRINEISFNAPLLKELKFLAMLAREEAEHDPEAKRWASLRLHRITSDLMVQLGYSSKLNAEWAFLTMLRDEGRRAAEAFITEHRDDLGVRSTLDLDALVDVY